MCECRSWFWSFTTFSFAFTSEYADYYYASTHAAVSPTPLALYLGENEIVVAENGDMTLKDSVGTGELYAKCYGVETKGGSFTMESGKITATKNSKVGTAIVNYGGEVVINDGTLSGNLAAIFTAGHFADATTVINGGTFTGTISIDEDCGPEDEAAGGTIHEDRAESVTADNNTYATDDGYEWIADGDVYKLTAAIFDNIDAITAEHGKGAELSIENAVSGMSAPFHAGAAKYFAEKGVTVETK